MTKRYDEPIEVDPDPVEADAPLAFRWRGRRYDIDQRMASWREGAEWWSSNGKARDRDYHRVLARPAGQSATGDLDPDGFLVNGYGAVYDLYRDRRTNAWRLARMWD